MDEKQYAIIWTAVGVWLSYFCIDSFWVTTSQESFAPGIGALDKDPYSAALWGVILGCSGLLFLAFIARSYVLSSKLKNCSEYSTPRIWGLEEQENRSSIIQKVNISIFIIIPLIMEVLLIVKLFKADIYINETSSMVGKGWLQSRIFALKHDCNAFSDFCFRLGGKGGDEYFPVLTDVVPVVLFVLCIFYLFKWHRLFRLYNKA